MHSEAGLLVSKYLCPKSLLFTYIDGLTADSGQMGKTRAEVRRSQHGISRGTTETGSNFTEQTEEVLTTGPQAHQYRAERRSLGV